jgi:hypothetical protein
VIHAAAVPAASAATPIPTTLARRGITARETSAGYWCGDSNPRWTKPPYRFSRPAYLIAVRHVGGAGATTAMTAAIGIAVPGCSDDFNHVESQRNIVAVSGVDPSMIA